MPFFAFQRLISSVLVRLTKFLWRWTHQIAGEHHIRCCMIFDWLLYITSNKLRSDYHSSLYTCFIFDISKKVELFNVGFVEFEVIIKNMTINLEIRSSDINNIQFSPTQSRQIVSVLHWGRESSLYIWYGRPIGSYRNLFVTICRHMVTFTILRLPYNTIFQHFS